MIERCAERSRAHVLSDAPPPLTPWNREGIPPRAAPGSARSHPPLETDFLVKEPSPSSDDDRLGFILMIHPSERDDPLGDLPVRRPQMDEQYLVLARFDDASEVGFQLFPLSIGQIAPKDRKLDMVAGAHHRFEHASQTLRVAHVVGHHEPRLHRV